MLAEFVANDRFAEACVAHDGGRQTQSMALLERLTGPWHRPRLHRRLPKPHFEFGHWCVESNPKEIMNQPGERRPRSLEMDVVPAVRDLSRDPTRPLQNLLQTDGCRSKRGARQQPFIPGPQVDTDFFDECAAVIKKQSLRSHLELSTHEQGGARSCPPNVLPLSRERRSRTHEVGRAAARRSSAAAACWAAFVEASHEAKSLSHCRCSSVSGTSRPRDCAIVLSAVTGSIPVATRTPPTINGNDYRAAQCGSAVVSQGT